MRDLVESTTGNARRTWLSCLLLAAAVWAYPQFASAQSIAGTIKDTSGSVLPGVTVEAASPALIEKVRTVVSDGSGQYRLENLVPGAYTVTYTLTGFAIVEARWRRADDGRDRDAQRRHESRRCAGNHHGHRRDAGGGRAEQHPRRSACSRGEVIAALPASRGYGNLLATVSGIQANGIQNSGIAPDMIFFTSRGGRSNEGTVQIDGMNVGSAFNGGGVAGYGYDTSNAQEVQVTVAGGLGEADRGGPAFNLIPKTGGNKFSGTYFGNLAGEWSQGNNVDDQLKSFGIPAPAAIIRSWDTSLAVGGPIKRDKVWFYGVTRLFGAYTDIAGRFGNLNAGDADPVGLHPRSEHQAAVGHQPEDRRRPRDRAALGAEQRQRLLRLSEGVRGRRLRQGRPAVPGARRRLGGGGRIRHVVAGIDALARQRRAHHAVQVHRAVDQQAAARSGRARSS